MHSAFSFEYPSAASLARALGNVKGHGDHWKCRCPLAHNHSTGDQNQVFAVDERDGKVYFSCMSASGNCSQSALLEKLQDMGLWPKSSQQSDIKKLINNKVNEPVARPKAPEEEKPEWYPNYNAPIATYSYRGVDGTELYQKLRFIDPRDNKKTFRFQRWDEESKKWIRKRVTDGIKRVPYRLPELLEAIKAGKPVFIVEGEKDADTCVANGYAAVSADSGGGSGKEGKWSPEYTQYFEGADCIYFMGDTDESGSVYGNIVCADLAKAGHKPRIIEVQGGKDITEVVDSGLPASMIDDWMVSSVEWVAPPEPPKEDPQVQIDFTPREENVTFISKEAKEVSESATSIIASFNDDGNGLRMAAQYGDVLRYAPGLGWLHWNGQILESAKDTITEFAKSVARSISSEPSEGSDETKKKFAFRNRSLDMPRLKAMTESAKTIPGIKLEAKDLDSDPMLLNCANGIVDLRNGKLIEHDVKYNCTRMVPINYDPKARCPKWLTFIEEIMGENPDLMLYLQRALGYGITGSIKEQKVFFLYGSGANGKSVLTGFMLWLLGQYGYSSGATMWMDRKYRDHSEAWVHLMNRRFVTGGEIAEGDKLDEARVKDFSGGDALLTRNLYSTETINFTAIGKLFLYGNHAPKIGDMTPSIWRRMRVIPFNVTIPEEKRNGNLLNELKEEASGILTWLVCGAIEWYESGLQEPAVIREALEKYKEDEDVLEMFISQYCIIDPTESARSTQLHKKYELMCQSEGYRPIGGKRFKAAMELKGFPHKRYKWGNGFTGLRLKTLAEVRAEMFVDGFSSEEE